jgi:hypothetical protein
VAKPSTLPQAIEIRREYPDAIEESVVFDAGEMQRAARPVEPRRTLRPEREATDPRQVESVMARIRALTGQKRPSTPDSPPKPQPGEAGLRAPAPTTSHWVQANPTPTADRPPPAPLRERYVADGVERELRPLEEARRTRTASAPDVATKRFEARRESERDSVQVSFGTIVVHVDPEPAPRVASAPPAGNASPPAAAAEAESRWARSFLDRN